jgi:hypothetical protein
MSCEINEALNRLAAEYEHAATQKERDAIWQEIVRVSYRQECDRDGAHPHRQREGGLTAAGVTLPHGDGAVPLRGSGSPPTEGLTFPNGGFRFPQRSGSPPPT